MDKKAKMFSILALGLLLVLGAVFVYAGAGSEEAVSADAGGGVEAAGACGNFCAWCLPTGGSCDTGGHCC